MLVHTGKLLCYPRNAIRYLKQNMCGKSVESHGPHQVECRMSAQGRERCCLHSDAPQRTWQPRVTSRWRVCGVDVVSNVLYSHIICHKQRESVMFYFILGN